MLAHGHNDQPSHSQSRPQTDKLYSSNQHKAPDLLDIADPGYGKYIDNYPAIDPFAVQKRYTNEFLLYLPIKQTIVFWCNKW